MLFKDSNLNVSEGVRDLDNSVVETRQGTLPMRQQVEASANAKEVRTQDY